MAVAIPFASAAPITGVTATSTMGECCGLFLVNIVNGSGLSSYDPSSIHAPTDSWISTSKTGSVTFNLNGSYLLGGIAVWNTAFGVSQYSLEVSTDGLAFTAIPGFPVSLANVASGSSTFSETQSFGAVLATHVRMNVLDGYSISNSSGLKEVMFLTADVPEPATVALFSSALLALVGWRRLRTRP